MYQLGATYLKLRATLNLDQVLPEIDPAVYNIRFANRLDFGNKATIVAREASRLVKRFKADWMTAGRRPAGICGACIVIASRMNDFLRTPEEVAQVVKVSPQTIKKRLQEFAQTAMATKTLQQWREMTDSELEKVDENELPPVVKEARAREARLKRLREATEDDESKHGSRAGTRAGSRVPSASGTPRKKPRILAPKPETADPDSAADDALAHLARDIGTPAPTDDADDEDMEALAKEDYVRDIQAAGDDTDEARDERRRERRKLFRGVKAAGGEEDDEELDELAADEDADDLADEKESPLDEAARLAASGGFREIPGPPNWDDKEVVYAYIETHFFGDEADLLYVSKQEKHARIERWLRGRAPKDVIGEMRSVQWAHHKREWEAKVSREEGFEDIDDAELENIFVMEDTEQQARARMWLSHNESWLQEDKERQIVKAQKAAKREADRGGRPATKRTKKPRRTQPFASAREAINDFASTKKFSSRINMDAIRKLDAGIANDEYDLQSMGDDDDWKADDKVDDKADDGDDDDFGETKRNQWWTMLTRQSSISQIVKLSTTSLTTTTTMMMKTTNRRIVLGLPVHIPRPAALTAD